MKNALLAVLIIFILSPLCSNALSGQVYLDLINTIEFSSEPFDIVLYDNAYVLTSTAVYPVSIKDPYNPTISDIQEFAGARSIAFIGHYSYILFANEIAVFDMTKSPLKKKTQIMTNGRISKIVIDNGYLYAINEDAGLQVYDVNIADFPVYKNTQIIPFNASGIAVSNNVAYVTSSLGHLTIIGLNDKAALPIIGTYTSGGRFYEPYVDGNLAYIPQGSSGVQVLDISVLPNPQWQFNLFGRGNSHQVVASNFYVWVADDKSIEGFYGDKPSSYYFAGNYKFPDKINRIAVIDGKYIYVTTKDKKLKILKIDYKY